MKIDLQRKLDNNFKNYSLFSVVFMLLLFGLSSCCTKIYCPGADDISPIELLNFSAEDVDSVFLVYYTKDSDFKIVNDSFMIEPNQPLGSEKFYVYSPIIMNVDFNYRLYFTSIDKTYKISGFQTGKSVCNNCFLSTDYYTSMDTYKVNGNLKTSHILQIDKLSD